MDARFGVDADISSADTLLPGAAAAVFLSQNDIFCPFGSENRVLEFEKKNEASIRLRNLYESFRWNDDYDVDKTPHFFYTHNHKRGEKIHRNIKRDEGMLQIFFAPARSSSKAWTFQSSSESTVTLIAVKIATALEVFQKW